MLMKSILLLLLTSLCYVVDATAQQRQFKPFRVELAGGIGIPASGRVGYLLAIEPKYALTDQISIGLRSESLVIYQKPFANLTTVGTLAIRSYSLTGDRYVELGGRKRLSLGAAVGIYQYALGTANYEDYKALTRDAFSTVLFGIAPRLGLELSHLKLGVDYSAVLNQAKQPISVSYVSAKVGLVIGGGRYPNR